MLENGVVSINNDKTKSFFLWQVDNFLRVNSILLDGYFTGVDQIMNAWPGIAPILYVTSVSTKSRKGLTFNKQWLT